MARFGAPCWLALPGFASPLGGLGPTGPQALRGGVLGQSGVFALDLLMIVHVAIVGERRPTGVAGGLWASRVWLWLASPWMMLPPPTQPGPLLRRVPERYRSLVALTVAVWLGWSHCTNSVFGATSHCSSSDSSRASSLSASIFKDSRGRSSQSLRSLNCCGMKDNGLLLGSSFRLRAPVGYSLCFSLKLRMSRGPRSSPSCCPLLWSWLNLPHFLVHCK